MHLSALQRQQNRGQCALGPGPSLSRLLDDPPALTARLWRAYLHDRGWSELEHALGAVARNDAAGAGVRGQALGAGDKAYLLTAYPKHGSEGGAISDPMGAELDVYRATADELESEIRRVFDRLAAGRVPGAQ